MIIAWPIMLMNGYDFRDAGMIGFLGLFILQPAIMILGDYVLVKRSALTGCQGINTGQHADQK